MASCEKCWSDAYMLMLSSPLKSQAEHYGDLVKERNCTPEQQAGEDANECPKCKRKTIHQIIGICIICGYKPKKL